MSNPSGKLFIGGLSFDTTDETFKNYFSEFGEVTDAFVLRDNVTKRSRGFGFVTFKTEAGADKCLAHKQPHILDKRQVEAKKATPRDQTPMSDGPPHHRRHDTSGRGGRGRGPLRSSYRSSSTATNNHNSNNSNNSQSGGIDSNNNNSANNPGGAVVGSSWATKATGGGNSRKSNVASSNVTSTTPSSSITNNNKIDSTTTSNNSNSNSHEKNNQVDGNNGGAGASGNNNKNTLSSTASNVRDNSNKANVPSSGPTGPSSYNPALTPEGQSKKIFVGGLHYDTDKVGLRKHFEQYGKILSSEVMYNRETNKSRGFGFVIYADAESVDRALETRMHMIDKKQAEVKRATPRVSSPIKPNVVGAPPKTGSNMNSTNVYGSNSYNTVNALSNGQGNSNSNVASIPVKAAPIHRNISWANVVSKGPPKESAQGGGNDGGGGGNNTVNSNSNNSNSSSSSSNNNISQNNNTSNRSSSNNGSNNSSGNSVSENNIASAKSTNANDGNNINSKKIPLSSSNKDGISKDSGKSVPPGVGVDPQQVQAQAAQQMQQQQALLAQQMQQQQQNNFVAQQALVARQQLAINQAMQQMMLNNLGQQGMDGQGQLMGGMNQQYQNFNQGLLNQHGQQQQVITNNPKSGASSKAPPGVEATGRAEKSKSGGDNVPTDKSIVVDGTGAGIAVEELATGADGKPIPSSVLGAGKGSSGGAFGDNTIPMGMAFQSFGGMTQSPPNMSQMNMLGQQGFPMGGNVGYDGSLTPMGMDMNSMNMGGGMMDMNSMNMGAMNNMGMGGLGGFGGFGMNQLGGGQQGSWGDQSGLSQQGSFNHQSGQQSQQGQQQKFNQQGMNGQQQQMQYGNMFGSNDFQQMGNSMQQQMQFQLQQQQQLFNQQQQQQLLAQQSNGAVQVEADDVALQQKGREKEVK